MPTRPRIIIALSFLTIALGAVVFAYSLYKKQPLTQKDDIRLSMREEERRTPIEDTGIIPPKSNFFREHESLPLPINNNDFKQKLGTLDGIVLDAREIEEVAIGRFPDSLHIRYGDIRSGDWRKLPTDKVVYVICYSGVRGEIVSTFLRARGILARYLENGAVDWVESGGEWEGEIDFYSVYSEPRYQQLLSQEGLQEAKQREAVFIDARAKYKFERSHLPASINIPIEYTSSQKLEQLFKSVLPGLPVVTICDDLSSCFDATIVGMRLEKRGHTFLGLHDVGDASFPLLRP